MIPILYVGTTQGPFTSNGKGLLTDAISCQVTEELNGSYDLIMKYPINGVHGSNIKERDIVVAQPGQKKDPQPFRIYRMTRPVNGIITVYAHHISYDLNDVPVMPFKALNPSGAVSSIKTNMVFSTPFTISAPFDKYRAGTLKISSPTNARAALMGEENSVASTFFTESAGQIYFDWYNIQIQNSRGIDRGVTITYGKNMTDYVKETNRSEFYNGILPYKKNNDGTIFTLPERFIMVSEGFLWKKLKIVDFSRMYEDDETLTAEDNLRNASIQYMKDNEFGKFTVSLDVSFVNLKDTAEYANITELQKVDLGDTVTVDMPMYGDTVKEICSKTVYNVLTEKYSSISIGKLRRGI